MIRCVVFDFDGTLLLSNEIKRDGFFAIAADYSNGHSVMASILADPPGDRFAIFAAFSAHYAADAGALAVRYSAWCEERILVCPERAGAGSLLAGLRQRGVKVYVNSATPEEPLRVVINKRYGVGFFDGVFGGHDRKIENLKVILALEELAPTELVFVGDGIDDRDASHAFGCAFVGVAEGTLAASSSNASSHLLTDLTAVERLIFDSHNTEAFSQ